MKSKTDKKTIISNYTDGAAAFKALSDPMCYPKIHPLITRVEKLEGDKYLCFETTKILFIPYNFKYSVSVCHGGKALTNMDSEVQKNIFLTLAFSLIDANNVLEQIEVAGPLLIRKALIRKVEKAHKEMHQKLRQKLASTSST